MPARGRVITRAALCSSLTCEMYAFTCGCHRARLPHTLEADILHNPGASARSVMFTGTDSDPRLEGWCQIVCQPWSDINCWAC